ncbi:MAG: M13 family metallopeptidase N-terminal domain-containing protein [Pirellulaceae bacterium]
MSGQVFSACVLAVVMGRTLGAQDLTSGIDQAWFDKSVRIQDDLFRHVNGVWLRQTLIPDDKSDYGSFTILMDQSQERIREIIEGAAANKHPAGSDAQKVGDFYRSFMDESAVQQLGVRPVKSELEKLASLDNKEQLFRHWGYLQTVGVDGPIAFFVTLDSKDSTRYLATVVQSGISLPDRDYYLEEDEKYLDSRKALIAYVVRLYQLAGIDDGDAAAGQFLVWKRDCSDPVGADGAARCQ